MSIVNFQVGRNFAEFARGMLYSRKICVVDCNSIVPADRCLPMEEMNGLTVTAYLRDHPMRKGLQSVLALCVLGTAQLCAQSVTLPAPRGILRDPGDQPRVDSTA